MAKEPDHRSEPPRYPAGKGGPSDDNDRRNPNPPNQGSQRQADQQNPKAHPPGQPTGQSQKSQIAQYFRSQGRQPDDVILDIAGMQLRLRDLDG